MALMTTRSFEDTILNLACDEDELFTVNHIFEPEFHQEIYVQACKKTQEMKGAFQIGRSDLLEREISRGMQPFYADEEDDPESLSFEGMILKNGKRSNNKSDNVCVLKSNCVRSGYIDTSLARSTTREKYESCMERAGVNKGDILINSTGDGTIGRVAVYDFNFPAVVDGHITIIRFKNKKLAWYVAAYLMTDDGQRQIYRYINGSSGQVEIYPQDISRIWVKPATDLEIERVYKKYQKACRTHDKFYRDLLNALNEV
ncbi:MAG: hypothetical protein K2G70_00680 [Turicibacter sp.]|nr:hypothetical protein [Turicibacter sp.]